MQCDMALVRLRRSLARLFSNESGNTWLNNLIGLRILCYIVVAVLATEPLIPQQHLDLLRQLDILLALVFAIEYSTRIWVPRIDMVKNLVC